ncbi:hypothetical protein CEXT_77821 [Caerostris extrusa]|uniref:Uncharacterized protein n=1 Tax=Caerostris extrusa TaxID=172846 RepID=A0AAV4U5K8_CAEEX|nr:hypothetical protein CEXT_77821 [Caerostris extrusa]
MVPRQTTFAEPIFGGITQCDEGSIMRTNTLAEESTSLRALFWNAVFGKKRIRGVMCPPSTRLNDRCSSHAPERPTDGC